jgi:hypothetical protein
MRFFIEFKNGPFSERRPGENTSILAEFIFRHVVQFRQRSLRWDDALEICVGRR